MDVVQARCCGLDVHRKAVVACLLVAGPGGAAREAVRTCGAMAADLLALADWRAAEGVTHVAMERTGVSRQPIGNLRAGSFAPRPVNARHGKAVPGRKTDVRDGAWPAELRRHGPLRPGFVPARPRRELRELTRSRTTLVRERSAEVNRLRKTPAGADRKLGAVTTQVVGASGRAILAALRAGATDPAAVAELARGKLRAKLPEPERAPAGRVRPHQRFLPARRLAHIDFLDATPEQVSAEIAERPGPFAAALARPDAIPGVGRRPAEGRLAEIGRDLRRSPTAGHPASRAGRCPGNHESAGQRRGGRTRRGSPWLRAALGAAGQAAGRNGGTYPAALYHRLAARRGKERAAVAVGHAIPVIADPLLPRATTYRDLGPNYSDERDRRRVGHRLSRRLEALGNKVTLEKVSRAEHFHRRCSSFRA
jgi:transposase